MIVSLMKRLPRSYKKFTQIPSEMMNKVQADLDREKQAKKEMLIKLGKKWGIYAGIALLVGIISLIIAVSAEIGLFYTIFVIALVAIYVIYRLFKKEYKQTRDLF